MKTIRRAQSALEYLFMLAASLIIVAVAVGVIARATKVLTKSVQSYTDQIKQQLLEGP